MELSELKQKLRQIKRLESQIRFKDLPQSQYGKFVWDEYFSTKDEIEGCSVKYDIRNLLKMDHQKLKEVFDEYFYHVYFQYYKENGITTKGLYDITLLASLGLAPDASIDTIKRKFRELAKKYHPDHGGESDKFIELIETYKKLTGDEG